jgi:catechol 2,3-dioxygenase-like lactoylglutathione lyase family enzyme
VNQQITFLFVADLERSAAFYASVLGLAEVLDQGTCRIYRAASGAFVGICERPDRVSPGGLILTFVTDDVDGWHRRITASGWPAESDPAENADYAIRHAFYRDPDGYLVEIQTFRDPRWSSA